MCEYSRCAFSYNISALITPTHPRIRKDAFLSALKVKISVISILKSSHEDVISVFNVYDSPGAWDSTMSTDRT